MHIDDREFILHTSEIVACLTKCQNTKELLERVHAILRKITYAENFCVVLLGDDGYLRFPYVADTENRVDLQSLDHLTVDDIHSNLIFYALTSNIVCNYSKEMIEHLQAESLVKVESKIPEQWLSFPLVADEHSLGAIILQTYDPDITYSDHDIELLVMISHVISNSLNVFSYQEQLFYANKSLKAYQSNLENLIEIKTETLEQKTLNLEMEVTERKKLQKELELNVLDLEQEIIKNKELGNKLEHQATHDYLTDLANRQYLNGYLARCGAKMARGKFTIYLLFIDLDGFKHINDNYGHAAGDAVLIEVSNRLTKLMRGYDIVARIGGDEFVVVLELVDSDELVENIGERIITEISRDYMFEDQKLTIGASIGVARAETKEQLDMVILNADHAMYAAKSEGKGRVCWHRE
ncbi:sensor domain-containing diguanylate cyclase [Psychrosphaera sp. 1_MG-2023]|uniref:sensor domain-containing diguanylate cyclase n=1 Tax=Psychrosphaera sp. 1_MG-2023 TaxID=3062643 RepID=UPI0026E39D3A|nr:sensor domain-containing diguanylate cyclase [Psychrosphaera sp. 1_MG-2023]MDO6719592.1 sensor domain-containing diguanylate cyclase [Psychrosphaera sp. 1_MG-2023]